MASKKPGAQLGWLILLVATLFPTLMPAQTLTLGNYTAISDAFWQLANLNQAPEVMGKYFDPRKGSQNFTHCCLLAVNESLQVVNGSIQNTTNFIQASVADLISATENGQFPCGATWNGNKNGAPVVAVPYSWYEQNCPGWELSDSRKGDESQWIQPFVGFLLPAVVFCVTIPRRRKLAVWQKLFIRDMSQVIQWVIAPFAMLIAGLIVTCDTVIWLSICFAFAGPMLLSGLYEAFLDNAVMGFLREKVRNGRLTLDMRARLLFVILVGNLDLDPRPNGEDKGPIDAVDPEAGNRPGEALEGIGLLGLQPTNNTGGGSQAETDQDKGEDGVSEGVCPKNGNAEGGDPQMDTNTPEGPELASNDEENWPDYQGPEDEIRDQDSAWMHIENLVHQLRTYRDMGPSMPRQSPLHAVGCKVYGSDCKDRNHQEMKIERDNAVKQEIGRTKTRLRTMLACQYSFGSTVGAPVVFFLGGFVSTLLATTGNLGDEDTSLALAFGIWYMIIPHISIVSGLLLAGNNPNTLEGVVALELGEVSEEEKKKEPLGFRLFELAYDSRYKPKWLWERGKSKRDWIERVWQTYEKQPDPLRKAETAIDDDMVELKKAATLTFLNWLVVVGLTLLLMGVPFILAFLTGFFTPEVGLSCRSLTFLVYAITQLCQIALWLWAYAGVPKKAGSIKFIRQDGWLHRNGFYNPTNYKSLWSSKTFFSLPSLWALIWHNLAAIFAIGGVVTSIGGTMMQLMGVYNSDICAITSWWWTKPHDMVMVVVSSNYALEIKEARKYWVPCGITATLFLGGVSFCGWWYQRRLRHLFREQVSKIDLKKRIGGNSGL